MDFATIIGFVLCVFFIIFGITSSGQMKDFYDLNSIYITIGGSIGATVLSVPFRYLKNFPRVFRAAFTEPNDNLLDYIEKILELSYTARKEGLLALENKAEELKSPFFKKGVLLAVDGMESQIIRDVLGAEIDALEQRHKEGRSIFDVAAVLFPAFGMIGTLIGLINMLKVLNSPDTIGPQLAVALVTTFYGIIFSNAFCIPLSHKLKARTEREVAIMEVIIEGVVSIQAGENTRFLEQKLLSFVNPRDKKKHTEGDYKYEEKEARIG